jgi:hypothetical protein
VVPAPEASREVAPVRVAVSALATFGAIAVARLGQKAEVAGRAVHPTVTDQPQMSEGSGAAKESVAVR